jgi:hypothetical protein
MVRNKWTICYGSSLFAFPLPLPGFLLAWSHVTLTAHTKDSDKADSIKRGIYWPKLYLFYCERFDEVRFGGLWSGIGDSQCVFFRHRCCKHAQYHCRKCKQHLLIFWHGYVLHEGITYKSRVPRTSQMTSRLLRHAAAAMRAYNVSYNSYNTRPLLCARITC